MFCVWKSSGPVSLIFFFFFFFFTSNILFLCVDFEVNDNNKNLYECRGAMLCKHYFFHFITFFFYIGIDVAGDTESTTYSSTCCTKFCSKLIRVKCWKLSKISLQSPREGIERSKLSLAMLFDSSYLCVDACPRVVLWAIRKKQVDLRILTMVVARNSDIIDNVNIALANTNMLFGFESQTTSTPAKHHTATAREPHTLCKRATSTCQTDHF